MDSEQVFLKRLWFKENKDLILREAEYHRNYEQEETYPTVVVFEHVASDQRER